jgi:HSP20 family protein
VLRAATEPLPDLGDIHATFDEAQDPTLDTPAPSGIGSRAKAMRSSSLSGPRAASLFLGEGLDAEHIEADYEHGVLTVTIPVAEQAKPRKVEIASGGKAQAIETGSR